MSGERGPAANAGFGPCEASHSATLAVPISVSQAGDPVAWVTAVFAAVHRHNRRASSGGFVGITLPAMDPGSHGFGRLGRVIRLVGSGTALDAALGDDALVAETGESLRAARGPFDRRLPEDAPLQMLLRDRRSADASPGDIRRRIRRAQRRGADASGPEAALARAEGRARRPLPREIAHAGGAVLARPLNLFVPFGKMPLYLALGSPEGREPPSEIRVSTWGLSDPEAPLLFAVDEPRRVPAHALAD